MGRAVAAAAAGVGGAAALAWLIVSDRPAAAGATGPALAAVAAPAIAPLSEGTAQAEIRLAAVAASQLPPNSCAAGPRHLPFALAGRTAGHLGGVEC